MQGEGGGRGGTDEEAAKLAQKLGQLQPFIHMYTLAQGPWTNFSLLYTILGCTHMYAFMYKRVYAYGCTWVCTFIAACIPTMHGPTCIFWTNLTPFSLHGALGAGAMKGVGDRGPQGREDILVSIIKTYR